MVDVVQNTNVWLNLRPTGKTPPGEGSDNWPGLTAKAGSAADKSDAPADRPETTKELMDYIRGKMQEIYNKIMNGDTEESYAIGSASYTKKEWEKLLSEFDTAEEAIQKEIAADLLTAEKVRTKTPTNRAGEKLQNKAVNALLAEKTSCTYPIEMENGELSEITWFTFYEKDRIYCIKEGCDGYEWELPLEDETQYEKVMAFLERQKDKENMRFASQQIFWQDYLSGELDKEGFQHFLDTRVEKGIPNYVNVDENGSYIDKEAFRFCKYMDQPFGELIATTDKEFLDWCMANAAKRKPTLQEIDPVEYHYRMFGDRGQRIHYFHGKLYTYEEVFPLEMQEAREAMAKAGNLIDDFYIRNGWTVERLWEVNSSVGKS